MDYWIPQKLSLLCVLVFVSVLPLQPYLISFPDLLEFVVEFLYYFAALTISLINKMGN